MKSVLRFETHSGEETEALGREISKLLPERGVVLLIGDLGSGKTTLTKGIVEARGAAAAADVSSPTFTLIHEYGDPVMVYHADLYRVESEEQARRVGIEDLFLQPALLLMEWAEKFPKLLPNQRTEIHLAHAGADNRIIEVHQPSNEL